MNYIDVLLLVGRILFGGFFILNGINHIAKTKNLVGYAQSKGVPSPTAAIIVSGILLLSGGLSMLFGIYVFWGVGAIVLFFIPVSFKMHAFWAIQDPMQRMAEKVQFKKNMALMGAALMLLSIPAPWAYSLPLG